MGMYMHTPLCGEYCVHIGVGSMVARSDDYRQSQGLYAWNGQQPVSTFFVSVSYRRLCIAFSPCMHDELL